MSENQQNIDSPQDEVTTPSSEPVKEDKSWWKSLIPTKEFFFTPLLIDINIVLFLLMVITSGKAGTIMLPDSELLIKWGANFKPKTINGEWWRLITSMFEHIGIIHLALNMYALMYIGVYLEPLLGKARYIGSYLATGLMASLVSVWWHDNAAAAGASGAIFGLYGVFFALLTTNLVDKSIRKPLLSSIGIFIVYNLAFGAAAGVDNAGHIGGLLSGFIFGYINYFSLKMQPMRNSFAAAGVILLISVAVVFITFPHINDPYGDYNRVMESFGKKERYH